MNCIECGEKTESFEKKGREFYRCQNGHENQRMVLNEGLETGEIDGKFHHYSVGAIVKAEDDILLLKRKKYPYKYTIPAGHLEEGEDPREAVKREIMEETGIEVDQVEKIFEGSLEDRCRRGTDYHYWNLYLIELEDKPEISLNNEAESFIWGLHDHDFTMATRTLLSEISDDS